MGKGMEIAVVYRDNDVARRAQNFLACQHFPSLQDLELEVERGELTLIGTVGSFYEKQVAMSVCQRVPGVLAFVDEVKVDDC